MVACLAAMVSLLVAPTARANEIGRAASPRLLAAVRPPSSQSPATQGSLRSDFNGDGFDDLAVGVYSEDLGAIPDAGAASVIYGSGAGLQAALPDDQFWTQDSPGMGADGAEAFDYFGRTLVAGDFNGDGFADLAIGVYGEDVGTIVDAGAVDVLYGSTCGLQADPTCGNPDDQYWTQDSPGVAGDGAEAGDQFGHYLVTGDFNDDGYSDLAVGVAGEAVGTVPDAGAVNVLYGSATGLQADAPDDQFWTQDSPGVMDKAEGRDHMGESLSSGDFNGDGFDDLVMPVFLEDLRHAADGGGVNILYGSACGLQADPTCGNPDDQFWTQNSPGVGADGAETGDQFGRSPAVGDFNGDGFDDLAAGAYHEDVGTVSNAGAVDVLYGSATGLQATGTGGPDDQFWTQGSAGMQDQAEEGDQFGRGIVAVDFNGDGFADLAIGAFGEDLGTIDEAGAVNVLYGSAAGLQADAPDDQFWTQDSEGVQDQAEANDQFGKTLRAGDFNADGFADLVVGVYWESVGTVSGAGLINVLYGSACGLQADPTCGNPDDQTFAQGQNGMGDKAEPWDRFGWFA